jgi:hypothetical protein
MATMTMKQQTTRLPSLAWGLPNTMHSLSVPIGMLGKEDGKNKSYLHSERSTFWERLGGKKGIDNRIVDLFTQVVDHLYSSDVNL